MPRFLVVTPTFQSAEFLDECIHSIISQAGGFELRYHIQDGGSTDSTWEIIQRWRKAIAENPDLFPCRVTLTAEQAPDDGMYDAIMKGFDRLRPRAGDVMTWLNSDDLLAAGAFKAVAGCMAANPSVALCGGRTALIDADSRLDHVSAPMLRSQTLMAAGLYDGRKLPFVMQEGSFWTGRLWKTVGGLDRGFRLAGDWDLWRRMAEHAPYVALDALTGFHRRRPGQLSGDIDAYHREVDRALTGEAAERYARLFEDYQSVNPDSLNFDNSAFPGVVGVVDPETRVWSLKEVYGEPLPPPMTISGDARAVGLRGEVLSGGRGAEGPYPDQGLPAGVRWINQPEAWLRLPMDAAGRIRVRLACRPSTARTRVVLEAGGETLLAALVSPQTPERDQILTFDCWASPGDNLIRLTTRASEGDPELRLLVVDLSYEPVNPAEEAPILSAQGPAVAIASGVEPQGLDRTLRSLSRQTLRASSVTVLATTDDARLRAVVAAFPGVQLEFVGSADHGRSGFKVLAEAAAEVGLKLAAGQELVPEALQGGHALLSAGDVSAIAGATIDIDARQRAHRRFRDAADVPWMATRTAWRELTDAPSETTADRRKAFLHLQRAGLAVETAPVLIDVRRDAAEAPQPLRALWLIVAGEESADAFGPALAEMGLDVRRLVLPAGAARAAQSAAFHKAAWDPSLVLASGNALQRLGPAAATLEPVAIDPELIVQAEALGPHSQGAGSLLELALAIGAVTGDVGAFRLANRRADLGVKPKGQPLRDKFGGQAYGLATTGDVELTRTWSTREGFGRERAPDVAANLPNPYRWIEGRKARIGVYSPSSGLRRLVIWLRSPCKRQRLIIRCEGREVHECSLGGGVMTQDQRLSMLVEMAAGWNDVSLEFSSVQTRGDQALAAIITGVDVKAGRRREVGPQGGWSYVQGADFQEAAYPQFGLFKPFRWSLDPCVLRLVPRTPGANRVTIQYQTAVAHQTLTATQQDVPVGRATVETSDLAVLRTLTFEVNLPAQGSDIRIAADRVMQDGRQLSFIIDEVIIESLGDTATPERIPARPWPSPRQFVRRVARAVRARLSR